MSDKVTERAIQQRLFIELRSARQIIVPNYTPAGWHECDLWAVTRAGYAQEYEIKLSARDFRADAQKKEGWRSRMKDGKWISLPPRTKHERLAAGDPEGPVRFWYVMPNGLSQSLTIPSWAGLIEAEVNHLGGLRLYRQRNGPRLHKEKVGKRVLDHAAAMCSRRYWDERNRADRLVGELQALRRAMDGDGQ